MLRPSVVSSLQTHVEAHAGTTPDIGSVACLHRVQSGMEPPIYRGAPTLISKNGALEIASDLFRLDGRQSWLFVVKLVQGPSLCKAAACARPSAICLLWLGAQNLGRIRRTQFASAGRCVCGAHRRCVCGWGCGTGAARRNRGSTSVSRIGVAVRGWIRGAHDFYINYVEMAPAGRGLPDTTLISNIYGGTGPKSTVWISIRRGDI
eukprot:7380164-Prymnesium_polylepis.2